MKVLVAIDSSAASQLVVETAVVRPWPQGTSFAVIHVVDVGAFTRVPALVEDALHAARIFVKEAGAKIARAGHDVTTEVFAGFPRRAIPQYAKDWGADLVMAGSHGQGAIKRFLIGSVAQAVLRAAPCSVEIVRPGAGDRPSGSGAMKILVATDGSEPAMAAVKSLVDRPWPAGTKVKIVSVVQLLAPENEMSASSLSSVYPASLLEELMSDAQGRAREAVAHARKTLAASQLEIVDEDPLPIGEPRDILLDCARNWKADIIVLGSHGWRGLDLLLIGSVSESVALHAECSVEVIRG